MFGHKEFLSDLRKGDLLTVYLSVIHSALKLVINWWVYGVALFVVFLFQTTRRTQIFKLSLVQTPSLLHCFFLILVHSVSSSFLEVNIKFLSVLHQCTQLKFWFLSLNSWFSNLWHKWLLSHTECLYSGVNGLHFLWIGQLLKFFHRLWLVCSDTKKSQIQFIYFVDHHFLNHIEFSYCFGLKLNFYL